MSNILVLHGPNLNLLGQREPEYYGALDLNSINKLIEGKAKLLGYSMEILQSNDETVLLERIHQCANDNTNFLIFNPAAFTHTSVALRDALLAVELPFIEVHLSNIYRREPFRHHSYFSDIALGVISGFGAASYTLALEALDQHVKQS